MPTRGIVHNGRVSRIGNEPPHFRHVSTSVQKRISAKFTVEKRNRTPYGTRSYLLGGAAWETRARESRLFPPCSLCGRPRGKRCCFELVLRQMPKEQLDRSQFKRT